MKCPFCGNEMKEGTLHSGGRYVQWKGVDALKAGKRNTFWQRAIWAVPKWRGTSVKNVEK